jgi:Zn-dependent protease
MTESYLLAFVLVILLHEAGHIAVAFSLGIKVKRVGLSWKGVYIVREPGTPLANMITTLAGPALNLLLALSWSAWPYFGMLNLVFAIANLAPHWGSDGQRALRLARLSFAQLT